MITVASGRNRELVKKDKALIGYLLAGYPDEDEFIRILKAIRNTNLDALEIGYPSNNPYVDGEIIKNAHLNINHDLAASLDYWQRIRKAVSKPIWLMAYKTDFIDNGRYLEFAKAGVIDALVIPDCSHEEHIRLDEELRQFTVDVVRFIRPTMDTKEIKKISEEAALLYGQLHEGPTGTARPNQQNYEAMLKAVLQFSKARIYAGFGINTKEDVRALLQKGFHGTILGTALVKRLNTSLETMIQYVNEITY